MFSERMKNKQVRTAGKKPIKYLEGIFLDT